MITLVLLGLAGFVAGAMNAVAGGGSFVTLPALVAAGLPAVVANASSTVALVPGAFASAWVFRRSLAGFGGLSLMVLLAISVAGGLVGALLLLATPARLFDGVVPWLLLVACLTFTFGQRAGAALRRRVQLGRRTLLGVQFGLAVYGGYFGGAVGIMMMAAWTLLHATDIRAMSAARTLLVGTMNATAVLCFIAADAVAWPETLAVLAGGIVGGTAGARVARRLDPGVLRGLVIALTVAMTVAFFVRAALGRTE